MLLNILINIFKVLKTIPWKLVDIWLVGIEACHMGDFDKTESRYQTKTIKHLPPQQFFYFSKKRILFLLFLSRVSIRKTFAERNAKFFVLCASVLRKKTTIFRNHSQKSFCAKLPYSGFCKTQVLRNSATRVLRIRKNQMVGDGVCFLEFNSSSAGRFCTKIRNRLFSKRLRLQHAYFFHYFI